MSSLFQPNQLFSKCVRSAGSQKQFGLIARKKTDAIYLELQAFDRRLNLNLVARKGLNSNLPTRAAAISATQILIQRAALELDVSADEFEALEPRLRASSPMLQIADSLINGSGLCRRLGEQVSRERKPLLAEMISSVVTDSTKWPLKDFLASDADGDHAQQCQTSCYRCIQRFGNRRYHGLLDWRLGLAYLRAMVTPNYLCGLSPAEKNLPEIVDWDARAHELAETVASMRSGTLAYQPLTSSNLPSIVERTHEGQEIARFVVIHPLWRCDPEVMSKVLCEDWSAELKFLDTFNLERRPLRALANVKAEEH
ncbi:MAG: hypothetical protein WDN06_02895 [Asticcacaulis sp.]